MIGDSPPVKLQPLNCVVFMDLIDVFPSCCSSWVTSLSSCALYVKIPEHQSLFVQLTTVAFTCRAFGCDPIFVLALLMLGL